MVECLFTQPLKGLQCRKEEGGRMGSRPTITESQRLIREECRAVEALLIQKNREYGDSALKPSRIFSRSNPGEQILVRIDDKLNRIQKGAGLLASDEDVVQDLIGYLILLKIALAQPPQQL